MIAGLLIGFFVNQNKLNGSTVESRELRLRQISNSGKVTTINKEITIEDYIINKINYTEAPLNDFSVEYYFVDINGNRYE